MSWLPGVAPFGFAVIFAVTICAAVVQRLAGLGFGTIVAPVAALIAVDYVPAAILLVGVPISAMGMSMDFRRAQLAEIAPALAGRFLATLPAAWLAGVLAGGRGLGVFIALTILVGVALGAAGVSVRKTRLTLFCAGGLSGFLATISSVGAAPIALIYQNDEARAARGGLNAFFFVGLLFAVGALALNGLIAARHVLMAAALLPAIVIGVLISLPLARHVDGRTLKPYALGLSVVAAVALLYRSAT